MRERATVRLPAGLAPRDGAVVPSVLAGLLARVMSRVAQAPFGRRGRVLLFACSWRLLMRGPVLRGPGPSALSSAHSFVAVPPRTVDEGAFSDERPSLRLLPLRMSSALISLGAGRSCACSHDGVRITRGAMQPTGCYRSWCSSLLLGRRRRWLAPLAGWWVRGGPRGARGALCGGPVVGLVGECRGGRGARR